MEYLVGALGIAVVVYGVVQMVRFQRLRRRWEAEDAAFWRRLERYEPGIRDRIRRRREGR